MVARRSAVPLQARPIHGQAPSPGPRGAAKPPRRLRAVVWFFLLLLLSAPLAFLLQGVDWPGTPAPQLPVDEATRADAATHKEAALPLQLEQRLQASGLAALVGGPVTDPQRPRDLAELLARVAGPDLPRIPLPEPARDNPIQNALAAYGDAMRIRLPSAPQLDLAIQRLELGPRGQAALGQLILAYSQAVVLQREAMSGLSPEERRFVGMDPATVGEWLAGQEEPTWEAYQREAIRILAAKGDAGKTFQAADLLARAAEAAKGPLAMDHAPTPRAGEAGLRTAGAAGPYAIVHGFLGVLIPNPPPPPNEPMDLRAALLSLHESYGFPVPSQKALDAGLPPSLDRAVARIVAAKAYGIATGDAEGEARLFLDAAANAQPVLKAWAALQRLQHEVPDLARPPASSSPAEAAAAPPAAAAGAPVAGLAVGQASSAGQDLAAFERARDAALRGLPPAERAAILQGPSVRAAFTRADWSNQDAGLVEAWAWAHLHMDPAHREALGIAAARLAQHPDRDGNACPDGLRAHECPPARVALAEAGGFPRLPAQAPPRAASSAGGEGEGSQGEGEEPPSSPAGREQDILFDDATANGDPEQSHLCQVVTMGGAANCVGPASLLRISGIGNNLFDHISVIHIDLGGDDDYLVEAAGPANIGLRDPPAQPEGCQAYHPSGSCFSQLDWPYCYTPGNVNLCIPPSFCPDATFERVCTPRSAAHGSYSLDVGGDDRYDTPDVETTQGAFGASEPTQRVDPSANATIAAHYNRGVAILLDTAGDDRYVAGQNSQGYARRGIGLLIDAQGNDTYGNAARQATVEGPQSLGGLFDLGGNDAYRFEFQANLVNTTGVAVLFDGGGADRYDSAIVPLDTFFATRATPASAIATQGRFHGTSTGLALFMDAGFERDTYLSLGIEGETNDLSAVNNDQALQNGAGSGTGLFIDGAPVGPGDLEDPDGDGVPSILETRVFGTAADDGDSNSGSLFRALQHLGEDPEDPLGMGVDGSWLDTPRLPVSIGAGQVLYLPGMIIGGRGDGHYPAWVPFIVDLGGNDTYTAPYTGGVIPFVEKQGVAPWVQRSDRPLTDVALLLDVGADAHGGDDAYLPGPCDIQVSDAVSHLQQPGDPAIRTGTPTNVKYAFPAACPSLGGAINGIAVLGDDGGSNLFQSSFRMDVTAETRPDSTTHFVAQLAGYGVMQGAGLFDGVGVLSTWNATNTFKANVSVRATEGGSSSQGPHRPSALARGVAQGAGLGGTGVLAAFGAASDTYMVEATATAVWPNGLDFGAAEADAQGAGLSGMGILFDEGGDNVLQALQGFAQGSASGDNLPANTLLAGAPNQCTTNMNTECMAPNVLQQPSVWMASRPPLGLLWTGGGNDTLEAGAFSQGSGLGRRCPVLWNDWNQAYNVGGTLALGALLDAGGHDRYLMRRQAPPTVLTQGFALRPDAAGIVFPCGWPSADPQLGLGQGAGALGGLGLLADGEGNDRYDARNANLTQGAGLLGSGALVDLGGHDEHLALGRSQGYAVHEFAEVHVGQQTARLTPTAANRVSASLRDDVGSEASGTLGVLLNQGGWDNYFLQGKGQGFAELKAHPLGRVESCMEVGVGENNIKPICTTEQEFCSYFKLVQATYGPTDWREDTCYSGESQPQNCSRFSQVPPPNQNGQPPPTTYVERCHASYTCLNVTTLQTGTKGGCHEVDSSFANGTNSKPTRLLPPHPLPILPNDFRCILQCPSSVVALLLDSGGNDTYEVPEPKCAVSPQAPSLDCMGDEDGNDWTWRQGTVVDASTCTAHAVGMAEPSLAWLRANPDGSCPIPSVVGGGIDSEDPLPLSESLANALLRQMGLAPLQAMDRVAKVTLVAYRDAARQSPLGPGERVAGDVYFDATVELNPGMGPANIQRLDFLVDGRLLGEGVRWGDGTRFFLPWVTREAGDTVASLRVPDGPHSVVASAFVTPDSGATTTHTPAGPPHNPTSRPTKNVESAPTAVHLDNPPLLEAHLSPSLIAPDLVQVSQLTVEVVPDYAETGGVETPGGRVLIFERHALAPEATLIHNASHAAGGFGLTLDGSCAGGCPDGGYTYVVEVVDEAGQTANATVQLIRDSLPPASNLQMVDVVGRADLEGASGAWVSWNHSDAVAGMGAGNSSGVASVRLIRLNPDDSLLQDLKEFDAAVNSTVVRGMSTGLQLRLITVATDHLGHSESPCLQQPVVETPPCYRMKLAARGASQSVMDFSEPSLSGLQPNPFHVAPGGTLGLQVQATDVGAGLDRVSVEFSAALAGAEMRRVGSSSTYVHDDTAQAVAPSPAEVPLVVTVRAVDKGGNQRVLSGVGFLDDLPPRVKPLPARYRDGAGGETLAAARGSTVVLRAQAIDVAVATVGVDLAALRPDPSGPDMKTCGKDPELPLTWRCEVLVPLDAPDGMLPVRWRVGDAAGNLNASAVSEVEVRTLAPTVTDVRISQPTPDGFVVRWRTDADATSQVQFGITPAVASSTLATLTYGQEHEVKLAGLLPATDYFVKPVSRNRAGSLGEGPVTGFRTLSAYTLDLPGLGEGTILNGTVALPLEVQWVDGQGDATPVEVTVHIQDAGRLASPQPLGSGSFTAGSYAFPFDTRRIPDGTYRLLLEGNRAGDTYLFASPPLAIDNTAPVAVPLSPLPGGHTTTPRPELAASVLDPSGTRPLPLEDIRLAIDGRPTSSFQAAFSQGWTEGTPQTLRLQLDRDLGEGPHTARIEVKDAGGNRGTVQWQFTVDSRAPTAQGAPRIEFPNATSAVRPGGVVRIALNVTDPAGVASGRADLGALGEPVPLLNRGGNRWTADVAIPSHAPSGPLLIPLIFSDALGTEGEAGRASIQVDAAPPALRSATVEAQGHTRLVLRVQASEPVLAEAASGPARATSSIPAANHTLRLEGLAPGRLHAVALLLTDMAGNTRQVPLEGTTPLDPEAPSATQLTVSSPGEGRVELRWTAASDNVGLAGYRVERREANGTWIPLALVPAANLSFEDPDAPQGSLAAYRVMAVDLGELAGPPAMATIQVLALPHLGAADIAPRLGPADRPFTFSVTYRHAGGLPPATAEARIGELRIPLAPVDGNPDCRSGCLLSGRARLPPTGIAPREPVVSFHAGVEGHEDRIELGWAPRVLAAADAGFQDTSAHPAALPPFPVLALALAGALLIFRRTSNPRRP